MKLIRSIPRPDGKVRITIELEADEGYRVIKEGQSFCIANPGENLIKINPDAYYTLGEPLHTDVFAGHILADARPAHWCSLEQKWIK